MRETTHFEHIVDTAAGFIDASGSLHGHTRELLKRLSRGTGAEFPEFENRGDTNAAMVKFVCDVLNLDGMDDLSNSKVNGLFSAVGNFRISRAEFIRAGQAFLQEMAIVGFVRRSAYAFTDVDEHAMQLFTPGMATKSGLKITEAMFADYGLNSDGAAVVRVPAELQGLLGLRGVVHDDKLRRCVLAAAEFMQSDETEMYPSFSLVSSSEVAAGATPFPRGIPILAGPTARRNQTPEPASL